MGTEQHFQLLEIGLTSCDVLVMFQIHYCGIPVCVSNPHQYVSWMGRETERCLCSDCSHYSAPLALVCSVCCGNGRGLILSFDRYYLWEERDIEKKSDPSPCPLLKW